MGRFRPTFLSELTNPRESILEITAKLKQVFHRMFGSADPSNADVQGIPKNSEDQIAGSDPSYVEDPNQKVTNLSEIFDDVC